MTAGDGEKTRIPDDQLWAKDKLELEFWKKYISDDFCFSANARGGNALASRFERALKKSQKAETEEGKHLAKDYGAAKGNDQALADFRQEWARKEYTGWANKR
eukprot:5906089-Pyramimonas_sp.AAC.1